MSQSPMLSLSARQQMTISPRLQQAIRLLQMSAVEFDQELRGALSSNPFLEDPAEEQSAGSPGEAAEQPQTGSEEAIAGVLTEGTQEIHLDRGYDEPLIAAAPASRLGESEDNDPGVWASARQDLRDHLRQQLYASPLSPRQRLAAEIVIETLDDDGYLRDDVAAVAAALELEEPLTDGEIAAGVELVRDFDPAGVGARDLIDCLQLQLHALDDGEPGRELALVLVREGVDLLARRDFAALRVRLGCDEPSLRQAHALIRRLDPRPGSRFGSAPADYVIPDVIVTQRNGQLIASINPALRPQARLNQRYIELLHRSRARAHPAMAQQLQEARWLLRNAEQRFITIQRVAEAILRRQRAFFIYGDVALRPMVLREVADEVGLHESTVSRATGNKYMATPRGLFEFKHFFSRQLPTRSGGACSAAAVRALMQELIEREDARAPLSDVTIADLLRNQGIQVARRTVAKYRTMMKVLPAELRRQA